MSYPIEGHANEEVLVSLNAVEVAKSVFPTNAPERGR